MIVSTDNIDDIIILINKAKYISVDTETTGLNAYKGDELFSIIISTGKDTYYFNFNYLSDHNCAIPLRQYQLCRGIIPKIISPDYRGTIFMHNAKFDMAFLYREGLDLSKQDTHCTMACHRVLNNAAESLSLANITGEKFDVVKKYISKHKLYDWIKNPSKKKREKKPFFSLVPLDIMYEYAKQDARITYELGMKQLKELSKDKELQDVFENEKQLTNVLFKIEAKGILINNEYVSNSIVYFRQVIADMRKKYKEITGFDDPEKRLELIKAFKEADYSVPLTDKGNPSLNDDALNKMSGELPDLIKEYREANKKLGTYFASYLYLQSNGVIHTSFMQAGTKSGRMSCREPNLQNVTKEEQ